MQEFTRSDILAIEAIARRYKLEGKLPDIAVSMLTAVGPSLLNRGQNGLQKTIHIGDVERLYASGASKWYAMRKSLIERDFIDYTHTRRIGDCVLMQYKQTNPSDELDEEIEKAIVAGVQGAVKADSKDSDGKEDGPTKKDSVVTYSESDIEALVRAVEEALAEAKETGKMKPEAIRKKITEVGKKMLKETYYSRRCSKYVALNGTFGAPDMIQQINGARLLTPMVSVTEYLGEYDDYLSTDSQDQIEGKKGGAFLSSRHTNSAIVAQTLDYRTSVYVRNRMIGRDYNDPKVWDAIIQEAIDEGKAVIKSFIRDMPVACQHNLLAPGTPLAVCGISTIGQIIDPIGYFFNPVQGEGCDIEAVSRLAAFCANDRFDDEDDHVFRHWLCCGVLAEDIRPEERDNIIVSQNINKFVDSLVSHTGLNEG